MSTQTVFDNILVIIIYLILSQLKYLNHHLLILKRSHKLVMYLCIQQMSMQ